MNTSPSQHDAADSHYLALNPHLKDQSPRQRIPNGPGVAQVAVRGYLGGEATRGAPPTQESKTLCLADLASQNVDWLWPGRIPIGKVTLLVGDPGVGKSLVALDIAARVTRGAPWPDASECGVANGEGGMNAAAAPDSDVPIPPSPFLLPPSPASVLLLSAEDDLADTVRPRLEAAGADCSRIVALPGAAGSDFADPAYPQCGLISERGIAAPLHHLATTRQRAGDFDQLNRVLDSRPDCRLVIIDPLSAYLGRGVENFNPEVRRWIAPLAALAARRRLAVLAVHHLRKQQASALHRTMGSLAFVAAARTTWLVAPDPADAQRRLLLPVKNNLAALGGPLSFAITTGPDEQPVIEWSREALAVTADEALRPPKQQKQPVGRPSFERDDAVRWLQQALAEGAKPAPQIERRAVAHGLRVITVRRAFRELGGEAVRIGFGPLGEWYWRLPGVGEQQPKPTLDHLWEE